MSSSVQKIGINIGGSGSDPVSFSTLRRTFFQNDPDVSVIGQDTVKASDLLRITNLPANGGSQTNPEWVPDATENASIVTTQSNWKVSHFQQSVKWYNIVQSGTDEQYSIDDQSWNSNLTKNIVKRMKITGTCGGTSNSVKGVSFSGSAYNLRIEVFGNIYGYGGKGGGTSGAPSISGESGGDALNVSSSTGRVIVDVKGVGKIYGGGGGGEKGKRGDDGADGRCYDSYRQQGGCGCPDCNSGWSNGPCSQNYGNHCDRKQVCNRWGNCWWESNGDTFSRTCYKDYSVNGGDGGTGGNGGPGRGYNNQTGSLAGVDGDPGGGKQGCYDGGSYTTTPTRGKTGETGGSGGNWGLSGGDTENTGDGGDAGRAISGSNYSVLGIINSDTIRGLYV